MRARLGLADCLATFDWLHPDAPATGGDVDVWQLCRAVLMSNAGQTAAARQILQSI